MALKTTQIYNDILTRVLMSLC